MSKQAIILSGGFGTRLSHIVKDVPKPMAPIQNKPFLDYQINLLKSNGFNDFILLTGYKSEIIENYYSKELNIRCIKETSPLGTGGAVLNAYQYLQDDFFIINGDTFFDIDFSILRNFGRDKPALIALRYSMDISRYGLVETDDKFKINKFIEKTSLPSNAIDGYINGGIYYFKKKTFDKEILSFNKTNKSMETDLFPKFVDQGMIYGLPIGGAFIDIGVPEDYYKAQTYIPETLNQDKKPAVFVDKDGTLIFDDGYVHGKNIKIISSTIKELQKYQRHGYKIIMVTNQAGIAKAKFSYKDMQENISAVIKQCKKYGIKITDVEYCPYHNDAILPEYRYDSKARKPEAGMILRACEKTRIDLKHSIMLGDNVKTDKIKLPYLRSKILER